MDFSFHLLGDANLSPLCRGGGLFRSMTCKGKSPKMTGQNLLWGEPLELLFPSSCDLSVEASLVAFLPPSCHIGAWRQRYRNRPSGTPLQISGYVRDNIQPWRTKKINKCGGLEYHCTWRTILSFPSSSNSLPPTSPKLKKSKPKPLSVYFT